MKLKTLLFGSLLAGTTFFIGANADAAETYTVADGDTLSTISQKYTGDNSLVEKIAADNQLTDVNVIFSGQQLTINTETSAPAPTTEKTTSAEPVTADQTTYQEPVVSYTTSETTAPAAAASTTNSAKEWIAQKESSGSYTATNGKYVGRYQLDSSYLNGDYSAENQERVAEQYVSSRYGSWEAAQSFWQANGWY